MGIITSRLNSLSNTFMMSTNDWMHFTESQMRNFEVAKAAGSMQTLAQLNMGAGGGTQAGGMANAWGGGNWYWLSSILYHLAPMGVLLGGAAAGIVYMNKAAASAMFGTAWIGLFFLFHVLISMMRSQSAGIATGQNIGTALAVSLMAAALIAFLLYDPYLEKRSKAEDARQPVVEQPVVDQPQVVIPNTNGGGYYVVGY
jgi:hypothetical protein